MLTNKSIWATTPTVSGRWLWIALWLMITPSPALAISQPDLRKLARESVENNEVLIVEPVITVSGRQLQWYLGGAQADLSVNDGGRFNPVDNPIKIPMDQQLTVEVIRKHRFRTNPEFWTRVFGRVEAVIARQLREVEMPSADPQTRIDKLQELDSEIYAVYEDEFRRLARERNLESVPQAGAAGQDPVVLRTSPPGRPIRLMHALEQRLATAENRPPKWQKVVDPNDVPVEGTYFYSVGQANGGFSPPKMIKLRAGRTYTLN